MKSPAFGKFASVVESWNQAAGRRGGDFIVRLATSQSVSVVLGDATGHGDSAAEIAGFIKPIIEREVCVGISDSLIRRWHRLVRRRFESSNRFVCLTGMVLDLESQMLSIVNAGNPDVLIWRGATQRIDRFPSDGMPLGIVDDYEWRAPSFQTTKLGGFDYALCVSDGVTDSVGNDGERFGLPRVCAALQLANAPSPLHSLRRGLLRFSSPTAEQDDVSILVLHGRYRQVA